MEQIDQEEYEAVEELNEVNLFCSLFVVGLVFFPENWSRDEK